jgi:hypothetical protein
MRKLPLAVLGASIALGALACEAPKVAPKPVPASLFARVQATPVADDVRYEGCHWSSVSYRMCLGMADITATAEVCNDCLLDADCPAGGRCVDAVVPGPESIPMKACAVPDTPCFTGSCPGMNACTTSGKSVICVPREPCVAA